MSPPFLDLSKPYRLHLSESCPTILDTRLRAPETYTVPGGRPVKQNLNHADRDDHRCDDDHGDAMDVIQQHGKSTSSSRVKRLKRPHVLVMGGGCPRSALVSPRCSNLPGSSQAGGARRADRIRHRTRHRDTPRTGEEVRRIFDVAGLHE